MNCNKGNRKATAHKISLPLTLIKANFPLPWNLPLSLTENIKITLLADLNAALSFFSFTGSVDHTP